MANIGGFIVQEHVDFFGIHLKHKYIYACLQQTTKWVCNKHIQVKEKMNSLLQLL